MRNSGTSMCEDKLTLTPETVANQNRGRTKSKPTKHLDSRIHELETLKEKHRRRFNFLITRGHSLDRIAIYRVKTGHLLARENLQIKPTASSRNACPIYGG